MPLTSSNTTIYENGENFYSTYYTCLVMGLWAIWFSLACITTELFVKTKMEMKLHSIVEVCLEKIRHSTIVIRMVTTWVTG